MKTILAKKAEQTHDIGAALGRLIQRGVRIALKGDLGAGKTTFIQGLAKGLNVPANYYVTSPTYNIINEYPAGELTLCHMDLYRLGDADELEYIGFDDLLDDHHVIAVEWPGLLEEIGFEFDLNIGFTFDDAYNRIITLSAAGQQGTNLLSRLIL